MNQFDELIAETKQMEAQAGWKKVWTAVFGLEKIIIAIKRPETKEEESEPYFFIGKIEDDGPTIFAFTDMEHYEAFEKQVQPETEVKFESKEISMDAFLNMAHTLALQGLKYTTFNFTSEHGFHAETSNIVPMYNAYIKNEYMQEEKIEENTMIQVAIPEELEELKDALNKVKSNYSTVLNTVSPVLVRVGQRINLTLIMEYKGGLPNELKKKVMENLHKELAQFPVFQKQIFFTEEKSIIPPNAKPFITVKF